ncbi:MAG: arginase family protein [Chthonomonas sp.]|nr:arginase family protein [Chthonomonas sp.]
MHHDPHWPRAGEWLKSSSENAIVQVQGVPLNKSITPGHCDEAPAAVRDALMYYSLADVEYFSSLDEFGVRDLGDSLDIEPYELPTILLGGDNGVTYHGVHAMGLPLDRIGLITLDAHFDLRHLDNGLHNGNPISALLRDGMPGKNITQLGIQSFANSPAYANVAAEAGINVVTIDDLYYQQIVPTLKEALDGTDVEAFYIDLDIDVLDRAHCPGAPGARPGGMRPEEVFDFAYFVGLEPRVRAMDIVEFDPRLDINKVTALTCAKAMLFFISGVSKRND